MPPYLAFLAFLLGLALGLSPILRRSLESLRWAALSSWAERRGIYSQELREDEMIGRLKEPSKPHVVTLRRAK